MEKLIAHIKLAPVYAIAAGIEARRKYEASLTEQQKRIIETTLMTVLAVMWLLIQKLYAWTIEVAIPFIQDQWEIQRQDWTTFHINVKYGPESSTAQLRELVLKQMELIEFFEEKAQELDLK